jgi:hypothetical protein
MPRKYLTYKACILFIADRTGLEPRLRRFKCGTINQQLITIHIKRGILKKRFQGDL